MSRAKEIKDMGCWGMQKGLLSEAEIDQLFAIFVGCEYPFRALEVGHYYGLSTYVIVEAMSSHDSLLSIDAHIKDDWVKDSNEAGYFKNLHDHFVPGQVQTLIMDSRAIQRLDGFDIVFYDGDHAEEQERFTRLVMASSDVQLFVFDDKDFPIPSDCCELLRATGWIDESPELRRLGGDKMNPETMTLGVFRRGL